MVYREAQHWLFLRSPLPDSHRTQALETILLSFYEQCIIFARLLPLLLAAVDFFSN